MQVPGVLETCLYVDDLDAAQLFYAHVLGLEFVAREADRHLFFRCGAGMLLLFRAEVTEVGGEVPPHGCRGAGHVAFAIRHDEEQRWREHLARHGVAIETEIPWNGRGQSIYFRDPAGNSLELVSPRIWGLPDPPRSTPAESR